MRWKSGGGLVPPKYGQTRIIKKFAWKPIEANGEYRWLEFVSIKQMYVSDGFPFHLSEFWIDVEFVNL